VGQNTPPNFVAGGPTFTGPFSAERGADNTLLFHFWIYPYSFQILQSKDQLLIQYNTIKP